MNKSGSFQLNIFYFFHLDLNSTGWIKIHEQRPPVWSHHKQANKAGKNIAKYFQEVKANSIRFNTEGDQDNRYKLSFLSVIGCTTQWSVKTYINHQSHLLFTFPFIFTFLFIPFLFLIQLRLVSCLNVLDQWNGKVLKCFLLLTKQ